MAKVEPQGSEKSEKISTQRKGLVICCAFSVLFLAKLQFKQKVDFFRVHSEHCCFKIQITKLLSD